MILALDTSGPWLVAGLWSPAAGVAGDRTLLAERRHAEILVVQIDALLRDAGVARTELAAVIVGTGPGSYTGLRVGLAAARGLGRGLGVPVYGADSLAAAAGGQLAPGEAAWVTVDARRGNVYAGHYRRESAGLTTLAAPARLALTDLQARAAADGMPVLVAGAPAVEWLARQAVAERRAEAVYL